MLQSLETLGAGFQLASHDLDIRGAGNLLGEEQSGHIKEVGFELYQSMLEEAIVNLKAGVSEPAADRWSPSITIGMPVLIPEDYVGDLSVRLSLYRRLADLDTEEEIENFGAEMRDRFGVLPDEVRYLFKVAAIKAFCRTANVGKIDAGPKGAVIAFRDNSFAHPDRLVIVHPQLRPGRQGAARHEGGVPAGLGDAGRAPRRHHGDHAAAGAARAEQEGGVIVPSATGAVLGYKTAAYGHLRNDRTTAMFDSSSSADDLASPLIACLTDDLIRVTRDWFTGRGFFVPQSGAAPPIETSEVASVSINIDSGQEHGDEHDDVMYPQVLPFILVHAGCVAAIWSGVSWQAVTICAVLYWLRMFAITAGYHRYFSHRAYATSRVFQFILAFLAQSSAQKSVLWWAAKHRHHHLHSDTAQDVHSPRHKGFLYSHLGWIFYRQHDATDLVKVSDLASYPS